MRTRPLPSLSSLKRIAAGLLLALPAFASLVTLLMFLPDWISVVVALAGLTLFNVGAEFNWRWTTLIGGTCMFSGVFAAALSGAFGNRASAADPTDVDKPPQFVTNSLGMKLAMIPVGEFLMGAPESDPDAEDHERPQHKVQISKPLYLGVHEVTVGSFRTFVDASEHRTGAETDGKGSSGYNAELLGFEYGKPGYTWKNVGWKQDDDHPVLNVTWDDAVAFCRWLSKKEGRTYRLPTEAEWEYACRARTSTRFFTGDSLEDTEKAANVLDQSLIVKWAAAERDLKLGKPHKYNIPVKWDDGYAFTAVVGKFKANAFGLHDMHGNAAEWCADWYDKDYYRDSPAVDPQGPESTNLGVVRGGTFLSSPKVSRATSRVASFRDYHNYVIGFRVAMDAK